MKHMDDDFRNQAEALLGIKDYGDRVTAAEPMQPANSLGALQALAYSWPANGTLATVYDCDDYAAATAAQEQLKKTKNPSQQAMGTINGGLLLWVTAETDSPLLAELLSSFAGRE